MPLVTVPQGKIGYVYARDGEPLAPSQTLGCVIPCNNFQDARGFLVGEQVSPDQEPITGQRGRQRAILREGVYAINLALFYVLTEDMVYRLDTGGPKEFKTLVNWQTELAELDGFNPVVIGGPIEAAGPAQSRQEDAGRQHGHRHGARRAVAAAGRDHRPGGGHRPQRQVLPQQLPGHRGVPPGRRPAGACSTCP